MPKPRLNVLYTRMGSLAGSTGKGVREQKVLEDRANDVADRVLHQSILESERRDIPGFGFIDGEFPIRPDPVTTFEQLRLDFPKPHFVIFLEVEITPGHALVLGGSGVGQSKVAVGCNPFD